MELIARPVWAGSLEERRTWGTKRVWAKGGNVIRGECVKAYVKNRASQKQANIIPFSLFGG